MTDHHAPTSLTPEDAALIKRFEACDIPLDEWNHTAHLRIAYSYLVRFGLEEATQRMRDGIPRFNASKSIPEAIDMGYHDTLTVAFVRIIHAMIASYGAGPDSASFLAEHTQLASKRLLRLYYTRDRIMSWEAKRGFVEPDLSPLPV